ncbi:hypothetical protein RI367_006954 [Sorochytrium milnesiophthora]
MSAQGNTSSKHVVIVTAPQQGHLIPVIELGVQLVRLNGCRVSVVVSKAAAESATKRHLVPAQYTQHLTLVPVDDGFEITEDGVPDPQRMLKTIQLFIAPYDKLARVIRTRNDLPGHKASDRDEQICPLPPHRVDHIVAELFASSCIEHIRSLGVPYSGFVPSSASANLFMLKALEGARDTATAAATAAGPPIDPPAGPPSPEMPKMHPDIAKFLGRSIALIFSCPRVLYNTYEGMEGGAMESLRKHPMTRNSTLYTVGPLSLCGREPVTDATTTVTAPKTGKTTEPVSPIAQYALSWLDKQHAAGRPVVYISHGSVAQLTSEQVVQLAQALDKLKDRVSFVWAMCVGQQAHLPASAGVDFDIFNDAATHVARQDATVLVMGWAPQFTILEHPATRAFVSHCGWNSTIEALGFGMPIVAWPMFAEQHANAAMVASPEVQIGVVVPGTAVAGGRLVPCDEIVATVQQVLGAAGQESTYYKNARRLGQLAHDAVKLDSGSTIKNLCAFLHDA